MQTAENIASEGDAPCVGASPAAIENKKIMQPGRPMRPAQAWGPCLPGSLLPQLRDSGLHSVPLDHHPATALARAYCGGG